MRDEGRSQLPAVSLSRITHYFWRQRHTPLTLFLTRKGSNWRFDSNNVNIGFMIAASKTSRGLLGYIFAPGLQLATRGSNLPLIHNRACGPQKGTSLALDTPIKTMIAVIPSKPNFHAAVAQSLSSRTRIFNKRQPRVILQEDSDPFRLLTQLVYTSHR